MALSAGDRKRRSDSFGEAPSSGADGGAKSVDQRKLATYFYAPGLADVDETASGRPRSRPPDVVRANLSAGRIR